MAAEFLTIWEAKPDVWLHSMHRASFHFDRAAAEAAFVAMRQTRHGRSCGVFARPAIMAGGKVYILQSDAAVEMTAPGSHHPAAA
jgi:hypothetical protein